MSSCQNLWLIVNHALTLKNVANGPDFNQYLQTLSTPISQQVVAIAHMNSSSRTGGKKRASLALHAPVLKPHLGSADSDFHWQGAHGIFFMIIPNSQSPAFCIDHMEEINGPCTTHTHNSVNDIQLICHDSWNILPFSSSWTLGSQSFRCVMSKTRTPHV